MLLIGMVMLISIGEWEKKAFVPYGNFDSTKFNLSVMEKIKEFQLKIEKKGAELFITYPGYQDSSYLNAKNQICEIQRCLKKYKFDIIASPERYIIPSSMTFNTPYHLNQNGVDYRTKLFIEDFKKTRIYNKSSLKK